MISTPMVIVVSSFLGPKLAFADLYQSKGSGRAKGDRRVYLPE